MLRLINPLLLPYVFLSICFLLINVILFTSCKIPFKFNLGIEGGIYFYLKV